MQPVVQYMRAEVCLFVCLLVQLLTRFCSQYGTLELLKTTSLRSIGLVEGSALFRYKMRVHDSSVVSNLLQDYVQGIRRRSTSRGAGYQCSGVRTRLL